MEKRRQVIACSNCKLLNVSPTCPAPALVTFRDATFTLALLRTWSTSEMTPGRSSLRKVRI